MGDKLYEVQCKGFDWFNVPKRRDKKKLDGTGCLSLSINRMPDRVNNIGKFTGAYHQVLRRILLVIFMTILYIFF